MPVPRLGDLRTIFDKTRTPLRVWLAAAWYLTNQKQGVSALGLQCVLGLGSYQTARTMLHRFRRAMVRPGRDKLKGLVEVDETYLSITDRKNPVTPAGRKSSTTKVLISMAGVHRVASLVQRWVLGTHHGSVQPEHLDAYLDEFVFRFNRRTSSSRGMLFYRLLQQAVVTPPVSYGDVVSKNAGDR